MASLQLTTPASGTLAIDQPYAASDGRTRYRRVLQLSMALDGVGKVSLDAASVRLMGTLSALVFDAYHDGTSRFARLEDAASGVLVRFDVRLALHEVELTAASGATSIALHRLDGGTAASDPTLEGPIASHVATFPTSGNAELFDVQLAMRAAAGLGTSVVRRVTVCGYPTGARLGLADPFHVDSVAFFWQSAGESRAAVAFDAGGAFAKALQDHLDARLPNADATVLSAPLAIALVIESDVPCSFQLTAGSGGTPELAASYSKVVEGFAESPDKQVLRFSDQEGYRQELSIAVPSGASVTAAELRALPSFRHSVADAAAASTVTTPLTEKSGLYLDGQSWVATRITPEATEPLRGVAVALLALRPDTQLHAELHSDAAGQPSGQVLCSGDLNAPALGIRAFTTWSFDMPGRWPAGGLWLVLTARRGAAIWLAEAASGDVLFLARDPAPGPFRLERRVSSLKPRCELMTAAARSGSVAGTAPCVVSIGAAEVLAFDPERQEAAADGSLLLDLRDALAAYLASATPSAGQYTVPVTFTAAVPGILTVYPPRIELG